MATLTVVMVLFFVMALVAAYTNRNLIFEQRISANSYRAARALSAADAAVDWTLAMLNGGRIDIACRPTVDTTQTDFRRRYLVDSANTTNGPGGYSLVWAANPALYPACIVSRDAQGVPRQNCICPSLASPNPAITTPADGIGTAYRIKLIPPGNAIRPGSMELMVNGCSSIGSGANACYSQSGDSPVVDALSTALTTVALVPALRVEPSAALTAGTSIDASAGALIAVNGDAGSGLTVHAGTTITASASSSFSGPPGSAPVDGQRANDAKLNQLARSLPDVWTTAMFGMDRASFQRQPATVLVDCTAGAGCTTANLTSTLAGYPRNPIWVNGDLNLDTATPLGSVADPVMLIVTGTLTLSNNVSMVGFIHAGAINWTAGANGAGLTGAMVSASSFTATGTATITYDKPALETIRLRYGSFVRVPGSWTLYSN